MTKRNIIIILLAAAITGAATSGCKKYLDVQPEGAYTDKQVYSNEKAIQQTLNGIYLDMAGNSLYGANMSTTIIELLAQRFKPANIASNGASLSVFNDYQYSNTIAQNFFDSTWRKAYSVIQETNVFIANIDGSIKARVLSEAHGNQLKGEALAIRALIHFDLSRLFDAIPYYEKANGTQQPILTKTEVMDKVTADLTNASQLLAQDPIITAGVTTSTDFYAGLRNQRLNYYAVKALLARAQLWKGNTQQAHDAAAEVLSKGEKWFSWTSYDAANDPTNPDRVFSTELLFGLYNPTMYINYATWFSPALGDGVIFAPDTSRLNTVFEGKLNDYRFSNTWRQQGKPYRTFFKYADGTLPTLPWRFLQPMVRKSELYYILAETDPDPTTALAYLNTARRNRGLAPLTDATTIPTELRKEYQKEFWGEGQLFFYYKRINATDVPYAAYPYDWYTITPVYEVPLPLSETTTR